MNQTEIKHNIEVLIEKAQKDFDCCHKRQKSYATRCQKLPIEKMSWERLNMLLQRTSERHSAGGFLAGLLRAQTEFVNFKL